SETALQRFQPSIGRLGQRHQLKLRRRTFWGTGTASRSPNKSAPSQRRHSALHVEQDAPSRQRDRSAALPTSPSAPLFVCSGSQTCAHFQESLGCLSGASAFARLIQRPPNSFRW